MLQKILNTQFTQHMGVEKYERGENRSGYRNGSYQRMLTTRVGRVMLQVCRDREGSFQPHLFERYQRSEKALFLGSAEMSFQGVSTRKVTEVFEELCGVAISKSQVSVLSQKLDETLSAWRKRPLDQPYRYVLVDARVQKVRENGRVISTASLIAVGVTEEGVKLIVSDDHRGLTLALDRFFQGIPLGKANSGISMGLLQDVFAARTQEEARARGLVLAEKLRDHKKDKIADWIEENLQDCLGVYAIPEKHRVQLRSTNMVERLNEKIKRRCQIIRVFPNRESALRMVSARCLEISDAWIERKYLGMEESKTVA